MIIKSSFTYFDNEGDAAAAAAAAAKKTGDGSEGNEPKTFTSEQVEKLLKEEKTKSQVERTNMVQQLEEIQQTSTLNEQQRKELEDQVTALREASMTTEERAKSALARKEQEYSGKLVTTENERDGWKDKYTQTRINNALLSAANSNELKPFHSDDIVNALGNNTFLKELVDDLGKKTGEFTVLVKFDDIDKDGKTTVVEMDPGQVVSKMSKMTRWSHLFQSSKISGSGGSASTTGEEVDLIKLAQTDTKKFLELASKNPELLN